MSNLYQRYASEIKVQPAYIAGLEKHGLSYFPGHGSICDAVGGQCAHCNTVLWVNSRLNPILSEPLPEQFRQGGPIYRKYIEEKLLRFLQSLPSCPVCGHKEFDRFINNVEFPRFADGSPYDPLVQSTKMINAPADEIKVWWYEA